MISVTAPVSPAYDYMKTVLFRPFDMEKWITLGFCAFLAALGSGGGSGGGSITSSGRNFGLSKGQFAFDDVKRWIADNMEWLIPVAAGAIILVLAVWVLFIWLSSRGQFMLLDGVVHNRGQVKQPWTQFASLANSLFRFRLVLAVASAILTLPLFGFVAYLVFPMLSNERINEGAIFGIIAIGVAAMVLGLLTLVVHVLTRSFIVPIMYLRNARCLESWREFSSLLSAHVGPFALYLLFLLLLKIAVGIAVIILVIVTCCIACIIGVPYVGAVVMLPVTVFFRNYSLLFLSQFGEQYDVFRSEAKRSAAL